MNPRRLSAILVLPASLALAACSSSTAGTGHNSASAAPSQGPSATPTGGSSSVVSSAAPTAADGAAALAARLQAGVANVKTAHIELNVGIGGQQLTASGDEKVNNGKLTALKLIENLPGGTGQIEIIVVGGKSYAKLPAALNKTNKSKKPYLLISKTSTNPTARLLATSIESTLSSASLDSIGAFARAAGSVKLVGRESVGGVPATHYSFVVDLAKLPATYPGKSGLSAAGLKSIPVDLFVDDQNRPIQATEKLTVAKRAVSSKVTVTKYNQPVTISAPPASQVSTS